MVVKEGEKKERKKKEKSGNVASGKWDVWESWCERNKKNKWFMYLSIGGIKVMCILSFTFEGNCGTKWKHYWSTWIGNIFSHLTLKL